VVLDSQIIITDGIIVEYYYKDIAEIKYVYSLQAESIEQAATVVGKDFSGIIIFQINKKALSWI